MSVRFVLLLAVIAGFGALTTLALLDVGYFGIFALPFKSWGGAQVLTDLVIVAILACIWIVRDARSSGRTSWPYVVIAVLAGSFGPLLYLAIGELRTREGRAQ